METFNMRHDISGRRCGPLVVVTGRTDDSEVSFALPDPLVEAVRAIAGAVVQPANMRHDGVRTAPDEPVGLPAGCYTMQPSGVVRRGTGGSASVSGPAERDGAALHATFTLPAAGVTVVAAC